MHTLYTLYTIECCSPSTRGIEVGLYYIGGISGGIFAIIMLNTVTIMNGDIFTRGELYCMYIYIYVIISIHM